MNAKLSHSSRSNNILLRYLRSGNLDNGQIYFIIIFMFIVVAVPTFLIERSEIGDGSRGTWAIPPYRDLFVASGVIEPPARSSSFKGGGADIGQLRLKDGNLIGFSCTPGLDDPSTTCIYDRSDLKFNLVGQHVTMRMLVMKKLYLPEYSAKFVDQDGSTQTTVPRRQQAIVMDVTCTTCQPPGNVLRYTDSTSRLRTYMTLHPSVSILDIIFAIAGFLIGLPIVIGILRSALLTVVHLSRAVR